MERQRAAGRCVPSLTFQSTLRVYSCARSGLEPSSVRKDGARGLASRSPAGRAPAGLDVTDAGSLAAGPVRCAVASRDRLASHPALWETSLELGGLWRSSSMACQHRARVRTSQYSGMH